MAEDKQPTAYRVDVPEASAWVTPQSGVKFTMGMRGEIGYELSLKFDTAEEAVTQSIGLLDEFDQQFTAWKEERKKRRAA